MSVTKQGETKADPDSADGSALAGLIARAGSFRGPAPVHLWNPAHCGAIDIRIDRAGTWHHEGRPILREALVRLFSTVLRREADGGYVLVTPAEKLDIRVDDVPFLAVEMAVETSEGRQNLVFRTNVGDVVTVDAEHPLRVAEAGEGEGLVPYVRVRGGLDARLARPLVHELADHFEQRGAEIGVVSGGQFFVLGQVSEGPANDGAELSGGAVSA
ncbi:hypothetical protein K32_32940 [Kaistia sp. 32K]|uniref:DUF1285 domain-containing protein n=1 Tax=Kaistia sp. 32K TaxID=2795690 RepID=UPI0019164363|nr:DUF1285 domain-containing protein [Kaistia sp. 32K]BCP54677.1 hypothetical protein K32_32940 [Kaistia sp. 32K]